MGAPRDAMRAVAGVLLLVGVSEGVRRSGLPWWVTVLLGLTAAQVIQDGQALERRHGGGSGGTDA